MVAKCLQIVFSLLIVAAISPSVNAQFLRVDEITFSGNKRTKDKIIQRELDFATGDRLQQSQLPEIFSRNENFLLNSGLFTMAKINISRWDVANESISVDVEVTEPLFIIGAPIFELADRNFNVWWNEFNASFKRVNYGARVILNNAWGYGERVKLTAQFGYTPKFDFSARLPFIDNNQNVRLEVAATYAQQKEVALYNSGNLQIFESREDEAVVFKRQNYRVSLIFRPELRVLHTFRVGYSNHWIDEFLVTEQNPNFFLNGRTRQQYVYAEYFFEWEKRDLPIMPTSGWYLSARFYKDGFGIFDDVSSTYVEPQFEYNRSVGKRWVWTGSVKGKIGLERNQQPYYNYRGLGFGDDYVRGYELYLVDGLDFFLMKQSFAYRALDRNVRFNWFPIKAMRVLPLKVYVAANYDNGFVNDPFYFQNNSFTNRWLHGGGLGVNVLFYNTVEFRVEASVNHLGEFGIFLNSNTAF